MCFTRACARSHRRLNGQKGPLPQDRAQYDRPQQIFRGDLVAGTSIAGGTEVLPLFFLPLLAGLSRQHLTLRLEIHAHVGRHSGNRHLRSRDHLARCGTGRRRRGHRLWLHRHCGLSARGARVCLLLHGSENGVALLGVVRCFIQYAFYQVIVAAVVFVIGNLSLAN